MNQDLPLLEQSGKGWTIKYKGKHLYAAGDPLAAVAKRINRLQLQERTLLYVPSLGLGYGLDALLQKLPPQCHILCVETDQQLMALAVNTATLPKDPRLTIIRTQDPAQAAAVLHHQNEGLFRRVQAVHLCAGYQFDRRLYNRIQEVLEEEIQNYWQNQMTLANMARLWVSNLFSNMVHLPRVQDLSTFCTDKPILVCGAGPSLDASLPLIRKIRHKVLLLCVDTALPALMAFEPDIVFVLEAQIANLQDFLPYRNPKTLLICDLISTPAVFRLFETIYVYATRFAPLQLFDRLNTCRLLPTPLPPLGSVGVAAVYAAQRMTARPILITGLDFGYTHGKTHARGTPMSLAQHMAAGRFSPHGMYSYQAIRKRPLIELNDKNGQALRSDLVLQTYARQLNRLLTDEGVFDLGQEGLPLNAQRLTDEDEVHTALDAASSITNPKHPKIRFEPDQKRMCSFLMAEKLILKEVRSDLVDYFQDQKSAPNLERIAYTILQSPDRDTLTPSLASRALVGIDYYQSRIDCTLNLLRS